MGGNTKKTVIFVYLFRGKWFIHLKIIHLPENPCTRRLSGKVFKRIFWMWKLIESVKCINQQRLQMIVSSKFKFGKRTEFQVKWIKWTAWSISRVADCRSSPTIHFLADRLNFSVFFVFVRWSCCRCWACRRSFVSRLSGCIVCFLCSINLRTSIPFSPGIARRKFIWKISLLK